MISHVVWRHRTISVSAPSYTITFPTSTLATPLPMLFRDWVYTFSQIYSIILSLYCPITLYSLPLVSFSFYFHCSPPTNFVTSFNIMQRWKWSEIRMPQSNFCIIVYREEERMLPGPRYTLFNNLFFSPLLSISLLHALPPQPTIGLRGVNEQTSWSLRRTP